MREQLPAYVLRGYSLRRLAYGYDGLPMDGNRIELPDLNPGVTHRFEARPSVPGIHKVAVDLLRPSGYSAFTVEYSKRPRRVDTRQKRSRDTPTLSCSILKGKDELLPIENRLIDETREADPVIRPGAAEITSRSV